MSVRPKFALDCPEANRIGMLDEDGEHLNRIAHGIVDLMMIACVCELNAKTEREFYVRIRMYLQIWPDLWLDTETPFTLDLVHKHIGLTINDQTQSKAYFAKHIANILREAAERDYRSESERAALSSTPVSRQAV